MLHLLQASPVCVQAHHLFHVTGRLLPRRLCLYAGDEFRVIDKVVEERVLGFGGNARILEHVFQFIDAIIGRRLARVTNIVARGARPQFSSPQAADAFFRDLKAAYGRDILSRISRGDAGAGRRLP